MAHIVTKWMWRPIKGPKFYHLSQSVFQKLSNKLLGTCLTMKLLNISTILACFTGANAKAIDINQVLRIQMEQLVHQYNFQKMNQHHGLKNKAERDSIKKDLMNQFRKMAHETEHKLGKRAQAKRRKRIRKTRA